VSNQVNIFEMAYGTLDPGVPPIEIYNWTTDEADYNRARVKARFFSVIPDPWIPIPGAPGVSVEVLPSKLDLEITRTWVTVWASDDGSPTGAHSFQRNVQITNVGDETTAYHLLRAETDNE
jgi:hypothetical protein